MVTKSTLVTVHWSVDEPPAEMVEGVAVNVIVGTATLSN